MAYSAAAPQMIGRLLRWTLRKAGRVTMDGIGIGLTAGVTVKILRTLLGVVVATIGT